VLARLFDPEEGGFGGAPKFPRASVFHFLLRQDDPSAREMVFLTLRKMAEGGLRDHLGGGFHRYSVDARWHVPHFEKMLYDQAQLAVAYLEAWKCSGEEIFSGIVRETLDYVLRDMTHPEGGFFSAEDADSALSGGGHAEGAFYVWTRAEIGEVLGPDEAEIFCRHYGVEENGNAPEGSDPHGEFTGKNILVRRLADEEPSLAASRARLLERRGGRQRPHRDDKILTAWNGLMISAFAQAGAAFGDARYLDAARKAARFLRTQSTSGGELLRVWREGAGAIRGFAEDSAFLIQALLDLYEADFNEDWLVWAEDLQARQDGLFRDAAAGNYFNSAAGDALVALRMKDDFDGAEPSVNSVSARNLLRLGRIFNDGTLEARGREVIAASAATLHRQPAALPQMLVALDLALSPPAQAVVVGDLEDPAVAEVLVRLHREFAPRRTLLRVGDWLAARNPDLAALKPVDGSPTLYRCQNFSCQSPERLTSKQSAP
jgi:uncharacterized protein YyaL (SSP411 family)